MTKKSPEEEDTLDCDEDITILERKTDVIKLPVSDTEQLVVTVTSEVQEAAPDPECADDRPPAKPPEDDPR